MGDNVIPLVDQRVAADVNGGGRVEMGRKVLVVVAVALVAAASWFAWRYPSAPAIETPAEVASSGEGQGNDAGEALGASVATGPGDATGDAAAPAAAEEPAPTAAAVETEPQPDAPRLPGLSGHQRA